MDKKLILSILTPVIKMIIADIVADIITSDNLSALRQRALSKLKIITTKNDWAWDDKLVDTITGALFDPALYAEFGDSILDFVEEWVASTETVWDDILVLPPIKAFRVVANIPDND